jgi:putative DNA primase/helicase
VKGNPRLHAAIDYASRGWLVNALKPDSKDLVQSGRSVLESATRDETLIRKWWKEGPQRNVGLVPGQESAFCLLDVDVKSGVDGLRALGALQEEFGPLPTTRFERTQSGGLHYFFRHPGIPLKNKKGKGNAAGLEFFGAPHNIVTAPSIVNGRPYELIADSDLAPLPQALIASFTESTRVNPVPEGARNSTLFAFACSLRARNQPESEAWLALQTRNTDCSPPLDERELRQLFKSAWKYPAGFPLTDLGNAERMVDKLGVSIRYLNGGGWYTYDGHRYVQDRSQRIIVLAGESARGIYAEAAIADDADRRKQLAAWAQQSESRTRIDNAVALAAPRVTEQIEDYDSNPLLIGLSNGVYDLARDEFRAGCPEDRITLAMKVDYDPSATCERWERFQLEIHAGDQEMVAFKRRAWGYSLTGDTSEQKLFMCYGEGANGKTTEQNIVLEIHGDYGLKIQPETLMAHARSGTANNDIARMRGARLIATVEVEDGGRLAESLVKQLTGGDRLAARFLYKEHFEFTLSGKIWIATNHRPEISGTDFAIWRRLLLIPYEVVFGGAQLDRQLAEKLMLERPGIFNWMLQGYREWRQRGLDPPASVVGATQGYREDMDRVGNFLRECCEFGEGVAEFTSGRHVYCAYEWWMKVSLQYSSYSRIRRQDSLP